MSEIMQNLRSTKILAAKRIQDLFVTGYITRAESTDYLLKIAGIRDAETGKNVIAELEKTILANLTRHTIQADSSSSSADPDPQTAEA